MRLSWPLWPICGLHVEEPTRKSTMMLHCVVTVCVCWKEPATGPLGVNISASRLKLQFQKFGDDTLRSSFATRMSRDLLTVVAHSRFKIIHWLVYCFQKRFYIVRMALLFSRFFMVDPKYLWFNGAKNCHIVNVSWLVKCYGNSTKRNWNVCCMHLLRLALRPIVFSA